MQAVDLSKPFSVDVFSESSSIGQSPWQRLGKFQSLDQAISTCKKVVDDYLTQYEHLAASPDLLTTNYLQHGPVPCINGVENLKAFDLYEYLNKRCNELIL